MLATPNVVASPPGMPLEDIRIYLAADGRPPQFAEELVRAHGIISADDRQVPVIVPVDTCWRIFLEHAALVGDEMHKVAGNSRLSPGMTSLIVARMLVCDTVADAIQAYSEATALVAPELEVNVVKRGDEVSLRWHFNAGESELQDIALESTAAVYYAVLSWLAGEELPVLRVRAPIGRQGSSSTLLNLLHAPVVHSGSSLEVFFSCEVAGMRIAKRDIRRWHDGVYKFLSAAVLRDDGVSARGSFTTKVRSALLEGYCQNRIADQWGMSTKTIARRLAQEGSSFRELRDEIRMEKAVSLIHAELSIEEIAYLVGYMDSRSFRRAFLRWYGMSPATYRMHHSASS